VKLEASSERLEKLRALLARDPSNSFTRYGIAMELKSLGRLQEAIEVFRELIQDDPEYVMAYQHAGYLLRDSGRTQEAVDLLRRGVEIAGKHGNDKALTEMEGALDDLRN
jgi:tetratricopeptide (TPR) repeat protein